MYNEKRDDMLENAKDDIINALDGYSGYYCDLHNEVFNTDYYIIGRANAIEELEEYGVFNAIEEVINFEKEQFGEITTDISDPERLVNMLYYVIGDEIICEMTSHIDVFFDKWNDKADDETNQCIIEALKEMIV